MKKSFEYDLTKYDPNAPTRTEQFLTADGAKTLTTDANDGAVLIQDSVDGDSLNPVTAAAVATAIEQGGGGGGVPDVVDPLYINPDDEVALRFGSGLTLEVGEAVEDDTLAVSLSGTGGLYYDETDDNALAVQLDPAGGLECVIDDGVQVGLGVKVDGTSITINADNELEAIGGGSSEQYKAGNGIAFNIDTADFKTAINVDPGNGLSWQDVVATGYCYADNKVPVQWSQSMYYGFRCADSGASLVALTGSSNQVKLQGIYNILWNVASEPVDNVYPYFYLRSDHSKYVTSSTYLPYTKSYNSGSDMWSITIDNQPLNQNLFVNTDNAGEGFTLADLTTNNWAMGFVLGTFDGVPNVAEPSTVYWFNDRSNNATWPQYSVAVDKKVAVANPLPAFNTTTDVGKVLQVTANGLAWVTLS